MLLIVIQLPGLVSIYTYDGLDRRVKVAVELPEAKLAGFKPDPFGEERVPRELREELGEAYAELLAAPELKTEYEYVHDLTAPYNDPLMVYGRHNGSVSRYTHGLEVLAMDTWKNISGNLQNQPPAGVGAKPDRSYFLQNNLGSPTRLLGEGGETKAYYSYDAFGKPALAVTAGSRENRQSNIFSYTGYQYDAATGLHFAQARYYMPEVGRFVSEDPVKGWIDEPLSLNPYVYCNNSPFKYVDPSGLVAKVSKPQTKAIETASAGCPHGDKINIWNEFQRAHKGMFSSPMEASDQYKKLIENQSPWPIGYSPQETILVPGTRFEMALAPGQPAVKPGAFGTFNNIKDVDFVRNNLAIKKEWKAEIDRVVTYEVLDDLPVVVGPVGPQIDKVAKRYLQGGGSQLQMLVSKSEQMKYLKVVNVRQIY